jgi:hypothetical protein
MDLPAEFYLETVKRVFQDHDLPLGRFTYRGEIVRPELIRRTAILTVEGERDDICANGQTMAALDLCSGRADLDAAASSADRRRALRGVQRQALEQRDLSEGARDDPVDEFNGPRRTRIPALIARRVRLEIDLTGQSGGVEVDAAP